MILQIKKHIKLHKIHSVPNWLFHRDDVILTQQIELDEIHMKELLMFLNDNSNFNSNDLKVSVVTFLGIILEYK